MFSLKRFERKKLKALTSMKINKKSIRIPLLALIVFAGFSYAQAKTSSVQDLSRYPGTSHAAMPRSEFPTIIHSAELDSSAKANIIYQVLESGNNEALAQDALDFTLLSSNIDDGLRLKIVTESLAQGASLEEFCKKFSHPSTAFDSSSATVNDAVLNLIYILLEGQKCPLFATSILRTLILRQNIEEDVRIKLTALTLAAGADFNCAGKQKLYRDGEVVEEINRNLCEHVILNTYNQRLSQDGFIQIANLFIEHGANLKVVDDKGQTLLDQLELENEPTPYRINYLKNLGLECNLVKRLEIAAHFGNTEELHALVAMGLDLGELMDVAPEETAEFVYGALQANHLDFVSALLGYGLDINLLIDGLTPLCIGALHPSSNFAHMVIEHGGDHLQHCELNTAGDLPEFIQTITRTKTFTPAYLAAAYGNIKVLQYLTNQGVDMSDPARAEGGTIAHGAAEEGAIHTLAYALEHGVDVNTQDRLGRTPLLIALENEHNDIAAYLIRQWEASLDTPDTFGRTAYSIAQEKGLKALLLNASSKGPLDLSHISQSTRLRMLWFTGGEKALKQEVDRGYTLVGILAAHNNPEFDLNLNENNEHPGVIIGYFSEAMMDTPGVFELFSGFIVPGAGDSLRTGKERYTAEELKKDPTPTEVFYQRMIPEFIKNNIPLIGMCAGTQHLIMAQGGAIQPADNRDTWDNTGIKGYTWQHFMMLSEEEHFQLLENCKAEDLSFPVSRDQSYAVEPESLSKLGFELSSESRLGNIMAYAKDFKTIVTQFHPEDYYSFDKNNYYGLECVVKLI